MKKLTLEYTCRFGNREQIEHRIEVSDVLEAIKIADIISEFLISASDRAIVTNSADLLEWDDEDQEWMTWQDEEGNEMRDVQYEISKWKKVTK